MATKKLKDMTTAELQARLKAASGRAFKATNREWLIDKITEVEAAKAKASTPAKAPTAARGRRASATAPTSVPAEAPSATIAPTPASGGKVRQTWTAMSIADLQAKYLATVGRATDSVDRGYLIWKIREATNGKVRTGPATRRANGEPTTPVTMRIADAALAGLDEVRTRLGYRSRLQLLAHAITLGLVQLGESALAGGFLPHGPAVAVGATGGAH